MVRQIRSCSNCQRRFASTSTLCSSCLDNNSSRSPRDTSVNSPVDSNDAAVLVPAVIDESVAFASESPRAKRRKPTAPSVDDVRSLVASSHSPNVAQKTASAASSTPGTCIFSDSEEDVPLAILFGKTVAAASDPVVLDYDNYDDDEDDDDDDDSNDEIPVFPPSALGDNICFICGADFSNLSTGLKGRSNHLKRCSKKHGVSARDIKLNDDAEDFVSEPTAAASSTIDNNPYVRKDDKWHAGADVDLALASHIDITDACVNTPMPLRKQTTISNFFQMPVRSLNNVLLAGARRVAKSANMLSARTNSKDIKAARRGGFQKRKRVDYSKLSCPMYKMISGTDFVVDGFMYAKSSLTKNYFLTHFHSDHYGGITKQWNAGIIYCSLETASLVHQQLDVDRKYLHPLGMMTPSIIECNGKPVSVTLLDANHCPGAVMFLFEVGKRRILHVGDFRWNRDLMMKCAPLRAFSTLQVRLDDLLLDTTYCDEKYTLPTQTEAIRATIEIAEKELERSKRRGQRALLLFGAYTIGKERIYLSVAERLHLKVYVDKRRYRILSALKWSKECMSILTTNPEASCLWVVPLGHINFKNMQSYLGGTSDKPFSKKTYDRVVGFRPTGWSMSASSDGIVSTKTKGSVTVHGVPYSEHSSFTELVDCLECLKPKRIIPTVSVSKSAEQVDLLLRKVKEKQGH